MCDSTAHPAAARRQSKIRWRWALAAPLIAGLGLAACSDSSLQPPSGPVAPALVCPPSQSTATHIRVARPDGGEVFRTGDACTVVVRADRPVRVGLALESGDEMFQLPLDRALDPATDSIFVFTIPDSFTVLRYDPGSGMQTPCKVSPVSDSCLIRVSEYGDPNVFDRSDCYFAIRPGLR